MKKYKILSFVMVFLFIFSSISLIVRAGGYQTEPAGLIGVSPTTDGGSDGKITGTTTSMEYKLSTALNYTAATETETLNLTAGTYYVRYAAKDGYDAGSDAVVLVANAITPGVQWEYSVNIDGSITLTKYLGNQTILEVPSQIAGRIVTRVEGIGDYSIVDITIPSTIEYIDKYIFYICSDSLKDINVDTNNMYYKSIDGVLFTKNMENLVAYPMKSSRDTYKIPVGVKTIEINAFAKSINIPRGALKNIYIPSTITSIKDTQYLAAQIANIDVDTANVTYKSIDGVLFNKSGDLLICYPLESPRTEYTVPEGTKEILSHDFVSPYGLSGNLITLSLPSSLEVFPDGFSVMSLQNIYVDPNNSYFTSIDGVLFSKDEKTLILYPMANLKTAYVIPSSVTKIRDDAFFNAYQCPSRALKDITFSESLSDYGDCLWHSWENIFVDEKNNSYKSISGVLFSKDGSTLIQYPTSKQNELFIIPDGTQLLKGYAFASCKNLKALIISNSVTNIEDGSVYACHQLADVVIYNKNVVIGNPNFVSQESTTIYSYDGSTAQTYAQNNKFTFRLIDEITLAPKGLTGVMPTSNGGSDGKILGTTTAMEYKLSTDLSYTVVTGTEITGLASGTYNVRYVAIIDGYNIGVDAVVEVGVNAKMNQAAPTGLIGVKAKTLGGSDGKITGTTTEMEYKISTSSSYTQVLGGEITGLAAGTYYVRYTSKAGYNAGLSAIVVVPDGYRSRGGGGGAVVIQPTEPIVPTVPEEITPIEPTAPLQPTTIANSEWRNVNNVWYYYLNGTVVKNGWARDWRGWCFLNATNGSWIQEGWAKDSKGWCYIQNGYWADYAMWAKDSNGWCYIGDDGYMVQHSTWARDSSGWCFIDDNGYWDGKPGVSIKPVQ